MTTTCRYLDAYLSKAKIPPSTRISTSRTSGSNTHGVDISIEGDTIGTLLMQVQENSDSPINSRSNSPSKASPSKDISDGERPSKYSPAREGLSLTARTISGSILSTGSPTLDMRTEGQPKFTGNAENTDDGGIGKAFSEAGGSVASINTQDTQDSHAGNIARLVRTSYPSHLLPY